jgi:predicted nucleic-acid-binding protein
MKSVGIDTCVVLRLLVGTPADQAEKASIFIKDSFINGCRVCVSDLVVAEAYHALIYHYAVPKIKAIRVLREFLEAPMIHSTGHALSVLAVYKGSGVGFVDRLVRMEALGHSSEIKTFDKDFAKLDNVSII